MDGLARRHVVVLRVSRRALVSPQIIEGRAARRRDRLEQGFRSRPRVVARARWDKIDTRTVKVRLLLRAVAAGA